ncbi:phosphopantetheine-binding protein [Nocardia farcinica]|nr:phosphopantetheine-binding protein [Nocardia farcinica]
MQTSTAPTSTAEDSAVSPTPLTRESIVRWCREYIAELLETTADAVDPATNFDRLGLDSAHAVALLIEVESRYGVELPAEALFDNPTLNGVADYLFTRVRSVEQR